MPRVIRRYITHDSSGRPLQVHSEHLSDDGAGNLRLTDRQSARYCSGCHRASIDVTELRGVCDACGVRQCCVHCVSHCQVCSKRLCGHCRMGFVGARSLTVCSNCHHRLTQRQAIEDQMQLDQQAFERWQARQRLLYQAEMLRLNEERLRLAAEAQAARMGTTKKTVLGHAVAIAGIAGGKVLEYVRRALP